MGALLGFFDAGILTAGFAAGEVAPFLNAGFDAALAPATTFAAVLSLGAAAFLGLPADGAFAAGRGEPFAGEGALGAEDVLATGRADAEPLPAADARR